MIKYLVVFQIGAELSNVGIFEADTKKNATEIARKQWRTTGSLEAYDIGDCESGWSFYV